MKYPKNSYITRGDTRRKILGELDDLRFLSLYEEEDEPNWETAAGGCIYHIAELERAGWGEEAWAPEYDESYWTYSRVTTMTFIWYNSGSDKELLTEKKIFRTEAEAEEARLKEYPNMDNAKTVKYADKEHWSEVAKNEEKIEELEKYLCSELRHDTVRAIIAKVKELFGK